MTIQKKLYYGFLAVLVIIALMFVVNLGGMVKQQASQDALRNALEEKSTTEAVRMQMMQNRLALGNYLLSGDTREADKLTTGLADLEKRIQLAESKAITPEQKSALSRVRELEQKWNSEFATPLINKRKDVDAGNATVAELQIFYLQ
ncbi:MAG TPA: hypothetical protein VL382_05345, partial [Terriglobales bacterium]|nr:hypothetical protein [Terriglobales bacterium]